MKITALIKQSLKSISSSKVRSSLTILGIVIGIAAVISLVGLGKGLQSNVQNSISSLGTTDFTPFIGKTQFKGVTANIAFTPKGELTTPAVTLYTYKDNARVTLN